MNALGAMKETTLEEAAQLVADACFERPGVVGEGFYHVAIGAQRLQMVETVMLEALYRAGLDIKRPFRRSIGTVIVQGEYGETVIQAITPANVSYWFGTQFHMAWLNGVVEDDYFYSELRCRLAALKGPLILS